MSIGNLMTQTVNVYRPSYSQQGVEQINGYNLVFADVPASIQPINSMEAFFYSQRGLEDVVTVYTTATGNIYERNDILEWVDQNGVDHQYHVVGIKNGLVKNIYCELTCNEYPSNGKKRLNKEAYK